MAGAVAKASAGTEVEVKKARAEDTPYATVSPSIVVARSRRRAAIVSKKNRWGKPAGSTVGESDQGLIFPTPAFAFTALRTASGDSSGA